MSCVAASRNGDPAACIHFGPVARGVVILAIDGALDRASAALVEAGAVRASLGQDGGRGQPALLPAMVARLLAQHPGLPPAVVVVTIGPGRFTGLRAAIALARGLAAGWGVPCHGVTTGEAMAAALPPAARGFRSVWSATAAGQRGFVLEREEDGGSDAPGPPPLRGWRAPLLIPAAAPLPPGVPGQGPVVLVGDAAAALVMRLGGMGDVVDSGITAPDAWAAGLAGFRRAAAGLRPRDAAPIYASPLYVAGPEG